MSYGAARFRRKWSFFLKSGSSFAFGLVDNTNGPYVRPSREADGSDGMVWRVVKRIFKKLKKAV